MEWFATILFPILVPVLTPVIVEGAKKAGEIIGKAVPINYLPAVAAAIGAVLEAVIGTNTIPGLPSGIAGALLGLAGVGLRELSNQIRRKGVQPSAIVAALALSSAIALSACGGSSGSDSLPDGSTISQNCEEIVITEDEEVEDDFQPPLPDGTSFAEKQLTCVQIIDGDSNTVGSTIEAE